MQLFCGDGFRFIHMKPFKALLAFVVIVAIGVLIGYLASRRTSSPPPEIAPTGATTSTQVTATVPDALKMTARTVNTNEVVNLYDGKLEGEEISTNPDDKIDDILGEVTDVTNVVNQLAEIYPKLSRAGKIEAVEHMINLVPDEDYTPLSKILTDKDVLPEVASDILTDLIDRPNDVKMPLMLAVARNPNHPGAKEAKENLELLIEPEEDLGDDWDKWEKAIEEWVKENPE